MSTLVLVEHDNQHMHASMPQVLASALQLSEPVVFCVIGYQCRGVAEQAALLQGVSSVLWLDDACYEHQFAENISQVVVSLADHYQTIMASSTTYGKNVLPRIAALLDVIQVSDVTRIVSHDTFERPIYAGNALETVRVLDNKKVLLIRATSFSAVVEVQSACAIDAITTTIPAANVTFVSKKASVSIRPELTHAKYIVSGGRALQNAENFKLIETLADTLGAAVGASRAAVDAGFISNDHQVGQTGKVVAPLLYIAVGISGAIQHLAGMKESKVIVAINKDEDAPIFQVADYGIVGDLFVLVPQLIEQLKKQE